MLLLLPVCILNPSCPFHHLPLLSDSYTDVKRIHLEPRNLNAYPLFMTPSQHQNHWHKDYCTAQRNQMRLNNSPVTSIMMTARVSLSARRGLSSMGTLLQFTRRRDPLRPVIYLLIRAGIVASFTNQGTVPPEWPLLHITAPLSSRLFPVDSHD